MPTPQARRRRDRAVYTVTVAASIVLGLAQQRVVHRLDVEAWEQCHDRLLNIRATKTLRAELSALDPRVAAIYGRHPLIVPTCGERP